MLTAVLILLIINLMFTMAAYGAVMRANPHLIARRRQVPPPWPDREGLP